MKLPTLPPLSALLVAAGLALAGPSHAAPADAHATHAEHGGPASLQLNAGRKWQTDEALRQAMANIRRAVAAALPEIHDKRLPAAGYGSLAKTVDSEVGNIVSHCQLAPAADAQLHLVVADLLAGAEQMAGKPQKAKRRDGALKVIGALEKYAAYFDDPQFTPIAH